MDYSIKYDIIDHVIRVDRIYTQIRMYIEYMYIVETHLIPNSHYILFDLMYK